MSLDRLPLLRTELSGALDSGESNKIFQIGYRPDSAGNMPGTSGYGVGQQEYVSGRPIIIKEYKLEIITDIVAMGWQWYCDNNDITESSNWDATNITCMENNKNYTLIPGNITDSETAVTYMPKITLKFKARKNFGWRKKKYGLWAVPPIVLNKNRRNTFGVSVANLSNFHDSRSYYALFTLKDWHSTT